MRILMASLALIFASPAFATAYVINPVVDLSQGTFSDNYVSAPFTNVQPLALKPGDTITGHLSFAGGDSLSMSYNGSPWSQWVAMQLFNPVDGSAVSWYTLSFTGVQGDFALTQPLWQFQPPFGPGSWNGSVGAIYVDQLTNSTFSFSGLDFSITYKGGVGLLDPEATSPPPTASQFSVGTFWASNALIRVISPSVPEPATWAMMLVGFGAIGFTMRRKPRLSAA